MPMLRLGISKTDQSHRHILRGAFLWIWPFTHKRCDMMHPYWITFERTPTPTLFNLGVGITARSEEDARELLATTIHDAPAIVNVTIIKDMRDLDQGHVMPNMGNWFCRGIWFPKGYE